MKQGCHASPLWNHSSLYLTYTFHFLKTMFLPMKKNVSWGKWNWYLLFEYSFACSFYTKSSRKRTLAPGALHSKYLLERVLRWWGKQAGQKLSYRSTVTWDGTESHSNGGQRVRSFCPRKKIHGFKLSLGKGHSRGRNIFFWLMII